MIYRAFLFAVAVLLTLYTLSTTGCGVSESSTQPPKQANIFSPANTQEWLTQFGTGATSLPSLPSDGALALASDSQSNVFAAGYTLGAFPGYTGPIGYPHAFVTKLDSTGRQLWTNEYGAAISSEILGGGTDASGNFLAAGRTNGAFPGFSNPSGTGEIFAMKLSSAGATLWLQQGLIGGYSAPTAATTDPSGNLYVAGYWAATPSSPGRGLFVEKLRASDGSVLWSQTYGGNTLDDINAITTDPNGNALVAGDSNGLFPGTNTTAAGLPFVLKLSGVDGSTTWVQQLQSAPLPPASILSAITSDAGGNAIVGGGVSTTFLSVNFGAVPGARCLLMKLDGQTGNVDWLETFGTGAGDQIFGIAAGTTGSIFAAGATDGLFAQNYTTTNDLFLLKFDNLGNNQWVQQVGNGAAGSIGNGSLLAATPDGGVTLSGPTNGAYVGFSNPNDSAETFIAHFLQ